MKTISTHVGFTQLVKKAIKTNQLLAFNLFLVAFAMLSSENISAKETGLPLAEQFRTSLYLLNADNSTILADGALEKFNNVYHAAVTGEDALKFINVNETLGFSRDGFFLSIEKRPLIVSTDTLFLKIQKTTQRNYQLVLISQNLDHPNELGFLEDTYLGSSTPIDLNGTTAVNFTIDANVGSQVDNRFRVVFRPAGVLPVTYSSVKAWQQNGNIALEWKVENELNINQYDVEKSIDGRNFTKVNSRSVAGNNSGVVYNWVDVNPAAGDNYYRILSVGAGGQKIYSSVMKVAILQKGNSISVYPNPVKGNVINLQFSNQPSGNYHFRLLNGMGQVVYTNEILVNNSNTTETLLLQQKPEKGTYALEVNGPGNTRTVQHVMVQ